MELRKLTLEPSVFIRGFKTTNLGTVNWKSLSILKFHAMFPLWYVGGVWLCVCLRISNKIESYMWYQSLPNCVCLKSANKNCCMHICCNIMFAKITPLLQINSSSARLALPHLTHITSHVNIHTYISATSGYKDSINLADIDTNNTQLLLRWSMRKVSFFRQY